MLLWMNAGVLDKKKGILTPQGCESSQVSGSLGNNALVIGFALV